MKKLSRTELLQRLQLLPVINKIADEAYEKSEEKAWKEQTGDSPHGHKWHVSFHASQFPGDDPMACPRQAVYQMMDIPSPTPTSRWLRGLAAVGKAIETDLVKALEDDGILLSAGPDEEIQTGFELPDQWFTGSVDCVILRNNKPLVIEIKTKFNRVIEEMRNGKRGPDDKHVAQIRAQLGLVRAFQDEKWPGLDPVTHGYIYYLSRDDPSITAEFRVDYDPAYFQAGLQRLEAFRKSFEAGELPTSDAATKRHPLGWYWSKPPCQFCPFKKICKEDHLNGVTKLEESCATEVAKKINPKYDYAKARKRVFDRWKGKNER
jgi:CRISPR/Cas system-associated exonuclease Cas4 (RecB family)